MSSESRADPIAFLKMTERQFRQLREALITPCGREHKVYAFLGETPGGLTVSRFWIPREEEYARRTPALVVMEGLPYLEFLDRYEDSGANGVLEFHSHPTCLKADFSSIDNWGIDRIRLAFDRRRPGALFARGVTGQREDGFSLELWDGDSVEWRRLEEIRVVGPNGHRRILSATRSEGPAVEPSDHEADERSWGTAGPGSPRRSEELRTKEEELRIENADIVVVGSGGTGWEVAESLATMGARNLTLIDGDKIEGRNLSRLIGGTPADVSAGRFKVLRLEAILRANDPGRTIEAIPEFFPGPRSVSAVQAADLVVCCVDRARPRHDLIRLCVRHHVPAIDCGTSISLTEDGSGERRRDGHVWLFVPGCRVCWHQMGLGGEALWPESLREAQEAAGYVLGSDEAISPGSVQTMNKVTAAAAVTLAEDYLLGRAPNHNLITLHQSIQGGYRYAAESGFVLPDPDCPLCGEGGFEGEGGDPFQAEHYSAEDRRVPELDLPPLPDGPLWDEASEVEEAGHPWEFQFVSDCERGKGGT